MKISLELKAESLKQKQSGLAQHLVSETIRRRRILVRSVDDSELSAGFAHIWLFVAVAVAVVGFVGWRVYNGSKTDKASQSPTSEASKVTWTLTQGGWKPIGTPPACPDPLVKFPVNLSLVTSILYPGQYRGGDYKPHGGFRFDNSTSNNVAVAAPMDAQVVRGAHYTVGGEDQYSFDFIASCGYMYRFGHILTLDSKLQALADKLPKNAEGDSRDTAVSPQDFKAGEVVATAVGLVNGDRNTINVFVDWGMYDLRTKNESSKNADWAAQHPSDIEQHAVCWFDLLSPDEEATVRALPSSDSGSGKTSDYCK